MKRLTAKTTNTSSKLPKISTNQLEIIKYIYKFRFITSPQFQKLFNHKDPSTTQQWLKELKDLKYLDTDYKRNDIEENRKPAKYFLAPLGRKYLKNLDGYDIDVLEKVYKEKGRKPPFKNHCVEIVDFYLFLISQKKPQEEIMFFTHSNLTKFDYFPDTELDAYVVFKEENKLRRFFLHIFRDSDPKWLPRQKIKEYITYFNDNTWQENTNNSPFPVILFVLPTDSLKFHIFKYGQAVLQKKLTVDIQLFLETKHAIKNGHPSNLWQKVSTEA